jgi:hypothetical protein
MRSVILLLILAGIGSYGYFSYFKKEAKPVYIKPIAHKIKPQISFSEQLTKKANANAALMVLNRLEKALKTLPVSLGGWRLHQVNYSYLSPNSFLATYVKAKGADMQAAIDLTKSLPINNEGVNGGILFANNDQAMRISLQLPKANRIIEETEIKAHLSTNEIPSIVSELQQHFLNYRLGALKPQTNGSSEQYLTVTNLDSLSLKALKDISQSHPTFIVESVIGTYKDDFKSNWELKGSLYV